MSVTPTPPPAKWDTLINKGSTWGPEVIEMLRDGVAVIPVSASFTVHDPDGTLVLTLAASIDGGGIMTVGPMSAATTAAITWEYGNLLFRTTEGDGTVTDLLAGNASVVNRGD
jgi:hypothetical protein